MSVETRQQPTLPLFFTRIPRYSRLSTATMFNSFPKVHVIRWNASRARIKCPCCERIHSHGSDRVGRRQSHCVEQTGGQYELLSSFEKDSGLVGYELDKRNAQFVNLRVHPDPDDESQDPEDDELVERLVKAQISMKEAPEFEVKWKSLPLRTATSLR